jgi:hypothetical protein
LNIFEKHVKNLFSPNAIKNRPNGEISPNLVTLNSRERIAPQMVEPYWLMTTRGCHVTFQTNQISASAITNNVRSCLK